MLWEAWQYFTTPVALPLAKKMNFLEEAIAMAARRDRCKSEWDEHFQHCQTAIIEAATACQQTRKIVIMGAGSLLDVPLTFLSKTFEEVILVDMVFLKPARQLVKPYSNITLLEQDVTNALDSISQGSFLPKNQASLKIDMTQVDCLVSLNLLSQLPLIPISWSMKQFGMTENQADQLAKKLIQDHLDLLKSCQGVQCLIADRWFSEFDAQGQLLDEFDPLWEVVVPEPQRTWDWTVIPLGEVDAKTRQQNRVGLNIN